MTQRIYSELTLPGWEAARPAIEQYVGSKKGYKKNKYKYSERTVSLVEEHWNYALKDWNYQL